MIDIKVFKQTLIKNGVDDMSEEDILKLRDQQDQMAEIFFDMWLEKVGNNKKEL